MSTINVEEINAINANLEGLITYMDNVCEDIAKAVDGAGAQGQEIVDAKMEELGAKMTEKLQPVRDGIVSNFRGKFQVIKEKIAPIEPLVNISISLDTVVDVVTSIIGIITAPYQPAIEFMTQVIPAVTTLAENLNKVINYIPSITVKDPNITIPPPKIDVEPISISDITG